MKIPRSVKIRGVRYPIRMVRDIRAAWERCVGQATGPIEAFAYFNRPLIYIDQSLAPVVMEKAYCHELAEIMAYNLPNNGEGRFTHAEIEAIGAMLHELLFCGNSKKEG